MTGSLEAIVMPSGRPALELGPDLAVLPRAPQIIVENAQVLSEAAKAVGRIERKGGLTPWTGTAFLVAPRLMLTASYMADLLSGTEAYICFANDPNAPGSERIAVQSAEKVHPYWPFMFLRLAGDAQATPLELADEPELARINGRDIVVISFIDTGISPHQDADQRLFEGRSGVKRISSGTITGIDEQHEFMGTPSFAHDATTLAGSGGGPLLDPVSGHVLGIHFAGDFRGNNVAAFAWETRRDPQWEYLWNPEAARPALTDAVTSSNVGPILEGEEYANIVSLFAEQLRVSLEDIEALKVGIDPRIRANMPTGTSIANALEFCIDYLNHWNIRSGNNGPYALYTFLDNARRRYDWDELSNFVDPILKRMSEKE